LRADSFKDVLLLLLLLPRYQVLSTLNVMAWKEAAFGSRLDESHFI